MTNGWLNNSNLLSDYLYTDVNNAQEHPIMKFVFRVLNYKQSPGLIENLEVLILMYKNNRYLTPSINKKI